MTTYSNPRMDLTVTDWPSGKHRTTAVFGVEQTPGRGERATRYTIDPKTGKPCATKRRTYALKARIADGCDGKTYIAELSSYGFVSIIQSDMQFQAEVIHHDNPQYTEVIALFKE